MATKGTKRVARESAKPAAAEHVTAAPPPTADPDMHKLLTEYGLNRDLLARMARFSRPPWHGGKKANARVTSRKGTGSRGSQAFWRGRPG